MRDLVDAAQAQGVVSQYGGDDTVAVYVEDSDTPMPLDATLEEAGLSNQSSVHLSRCTKVTVTVHYNGQNRSETFGPGIPMHRVKAWSVGEKGFDLNLTLDVGVTGERGPRGDLVVQNGES